MSGDFRLCSSNVTVDCICNLASERCTSLSPAMLAPHRHECLIANGPLVLRRTQLIQAYTFSHYSLHYSWHYHYSQDMLVILMLIMLMVMVMVMVMVYSPDIHLPQEQQCQRGSTSCAEPAGGTQMLCAPEQSPD